jgi:uncharacterized protein YdeI (YjbR/CyaY-like superfamily)
VKPRFFRTPADFRAWLAEHHASARELIVGYWRRDTGRASITWPKSVDEALCFGWIDGVRRSVDEHSFSVRFTPRRRGSYWSAVNRARAAELEAAGRMHAAGRAALPAKAPAASGRYSFERRPTALPPVFLRRLRADERAHAFYTAQPPWYQRSCAFWVMSAKQETTRERRFCVLLDCSRAQRAVPPLARPAR